MTMLSDLIKVRPSVEPFINFERSLKDDAVCSGFVPVRSTLDVFAFLRDATSTHATSRAAICYGTYGSGKSRLCVVLARLFSEGFKSPALEPVWERMTSRGWKDDLTKLQDVMCPGQRKWRPWLVVPLFAGGTASTIDAALLHALLGVVRDSDLPSTLLGTTIYEAAARRFEHMIHNGRRYEAAPDSKYVTAELLIRALREDSSPEALRALDDWHRKETAGLTLEGAMKDQPDLCTNAHELYKHMATGIGAHGYEGIVVVWDEFGFAVEELLRGAAKGSRSIGQEAMDLQNFLEHACGGTDLDGKVIFLGFTHVSLNEYGSRAGLNKQEQDRLTVVSGRFRDPDIPIRLSVTEAEGYHLLAGMKEMTPAGAELLSNEFPRLRALAKRMPTYNLWEQFSSEHCYNDIIKPAYPLHPATATALLMLSDRIAQVNRTAFYFMQDRANGGFAARLQEAELPEREAIGSSELIRVPHLHGFFAKAIRDYDREASRRYEDALLQLPDIEPLQEDLLRTVLILKTAGISPTTDMLAFCLCDTEAADSAATALHTALEQCVESNALWKNEATDVWDFAKFSVDVEEPIEEQLALIPEREPAFFVVSDQEVQSELAEYCGLLDMEPAESGIVRRVRVKVLDLRKGVDGIPPLNPAVKEASDGWCSAAIYFVIAENANTIRHWREQVMQLQQSSTYFLIPQEPVVIESDVRRFIAIMRVLEKGNLDKARREILDSRFTALRRDLRSEFGRFFGSDGLRSGMCSVMKAGCNATISGIESWNDLLLHVADECSKEFDQEIRVRCGRYNEWLDGRALSTIQSVIEHIIDFDESPSYNDQYLGFKDTSEDAAVVDGILVENGYYDKDLHEKWSFTRIEQTANGQRPSPLELVQQHFTKGGSNEKPFTRLFSELIEPPYGIPNGVIPLLVALAMRDHLDRLALYVRKGGSSVRVQKKDLRKEIAELAASPGKYTSRYEQLAGKKRYVMKAVGQFQGMSFSPAESAGESFYEKCREIRKDLADWVRGLSAAVIDSTALSSAERELVKSLRGPVPPQLPELADYLVSLFCEDSDCDEEIKEAGPAKSDYPQMRAYWRHFRDKMGRIADGARAPVDNIIKRITESGGVPLSKALAPLVSGDGDRIERAVKELNTKENPDTNDVVAVLSGKPMSQINEEDYGWAHGVLDVVEKFTARGGQIKVILPNRTVSLAPLAADKDRKLVEEPLSALRQQSGLSAKQFARLVLEVLFLREPEESDTVDTEPAKP